MKIKQLKQFLLPLDDEIECTVLYFNYDKKTYEHFPINPSLVRGELSFITIHHENN